MVKVDTLEGSINDVLWYHYDVTNDVLYLRLAGERSTRGIGEETDDGFILLRNERTDKPIGLTIVNWWRRFGHGSFPDSIAEIHSRIEPLSSKLAA